MHRLLVSLLVLAPGLAVAQVTGQLAGTVTGGGGRPLAGVTVVVDELAMAEITDSAGSYRLVGLPPGAYTVTFSLGDHNQKAEARIEAGKTTRLDEKVEWEAGHAARSPP